jgi:hypothetical protein
LSIKKPDASAVMVTAELARVYIVGRRRYITKRAAIHRMAFERVYAKHRCECEPPSADMVYPGYECGIHEYAGKLIARYERYLRRRLASPSGIKI